MANDMLPVCSELSVLSNGDDHSVVQKPGELLQKECDFTSTVIAFQGYQNRLMVFEKCCCGAHGVGEAY